MNRQTYFNYIEEQLSLLATRVELKGSLNLFDTHQQCEIFYRDFFNLLFDWRLENADYHQRNAPGIDLIDSFKKIVIQVSSTATPEKVNSSLEKSEKYKGYHFKFISISKNADALRKKSFNTPPSLQFDPTKDIYDVARLLKEIKNLKTDELEKIYQFFQTEFASKVKNLYQPRISSNLPPLTDCFVGRFAQREQLNNALKSRDISITCIIAAGGIGKTTLIQKWLRELNQADYKILAWSFYNQGTNDNSQTSSTPFFSEAFKFFNYQTKAIDETERGRELAALVQQSATIVVLDGLEPLQHSEKSDNGFLKDPAIDAFLTSVLNAKLGGNSLVVISTRQPLTRFMDKKGYVSHDLLKLDESDAVQLLKNLGVTKGLTKEFIEAVNFYGCHTLALMLLGKMLVDFFEQDIRYYREIPLLEEEMQGRHAERILNFYVTRWQDDEPEKLFLYLLGLFDRPMNQAEREELFQKAIIAKPLAALNSLKLKQTIKRLRDLKLLTDDSDCYDCHPIIRNYFGLKFKENNPEAFKQAHYVLFDYYQKLPEKLPKTLEEMQPLYRAVVHGCLAGEYQQALEKVFQQRIRRKDHNSSKSYSLHKLGAYSQDLTVLASFFSSNWQSPVQTLDEVQQAWLLQAISFCFASLGRLENAIEPRKLHLNLATQLAKKQLEEWSTVIVSGYNLVDCYITLGRLSDAEITAKKMVDDATPDAFAWKFKSLSYLATILHRSGNFDEARKYFQQAEQLLKPYLTSVSGYQYCSLLLDSFVSDEVTKRVTYSLKKHEGKNSLLTDALDYLTLARINVILNKDAEAKSIFEKAIQSIQKANKVNYEPIFYLYRADFCLTQNKLNQAKDDLNSAWEIIKRCGMKLYEVDYRLIHGRYSLATADFDTALNHYQEAKQLISETGYHLRDAELDLLAAEYCRSAKHVLHSKDANYYLQKAKNRIEEIGQWGLMPCWETVNTIARIK
jgi:tetratricopeptide (TPR) repeat protein